MEQETKKIEVGQYCSKLSDGKIWRVDTVLPLVKSSEDVIGVDQIGVVPVTFHQGESGEVTEVWDARVVKILSTKFSSQFKIINKRNKEWKDARKKVILHPRAAIMEACKTLIPEDRYDIREENGYLVLIIHYPSITVRNSNGRHHEMKDLFVRLQFNMMNWKLIGFHVTRRTLNAQEARHSYYFSHARTNTTEGEDWRGLCLGGGTSIALNVADLNRCFNRRIFEAFLITLDDYFSWESVEGVPYIHINAGAILPRKTAVFGLRNPNLTEDRKHKFLNYMRENVSVRDLVSHGYPSQIYVDSTDPVRGTLDCRIARLDKKIIEGVQRETGIEMICWLQRDGSRANEVRPQSFPVNVNPLELKFKDKRFPLKVEPLPTDSLELDKDEAFLHPWAEEGLKLHLAREINEILHGELINEYNDEYSKYKENITRADRSKERETGDIFKDSSADSSAPRKSRKKRVVRSPGVQ